MSMKIQFLFKKGPLMKITIIIFVLCFLLIFTGYFSSPEHAEYTIINEYTRKLAKDEVYTLSKEPYKNDGIFYWDFTLEKYPNLTFSVGEYHERSLRGAGLVLSLSKSLVLKNNMSFVLLSHMLDSYNAELTKHGPNELSQCARTKEVLFGGVVGATTITLDMDTVSQITLAESYMNGLWAYRQKRFPLLLTPCFNVNFIVPGYFSDRSDKDKSSAVSFSLDYPLRDWQDSFQKSLLRFCNIHSYALDGITDGMRQSAYEKEAFLRYHEIRLCLKGGPDLIAYEMKGKETRSLQKLSGIWLSVGGAYDLFIRLNLRPEGSSQSFRIEGKDGKIYSFSYNNRDIDNKFRGDWFYLIDGKEYSDGISRRDDFPVSDESFYNITGISLAELKRN